jgi:lipid-binding SYLF domain-containing protein
MKTLLFTLALVVVAGSAAAQTRSELDNRVRKIMTRLESLQSQSDVAIPAGKLKKAVGIILMERTKGGFIFGYEQGSGVAMVKDEEGKWSPISFMTSHEGSFGAQVGGKNTFSVVLLMNDAAKERLVQSKVKFGGEAAGTAGESSGSTNENPTEDAPVLVYGASSGVYGGATVQAGSVAADDKANQAYYGEFHTSKEILFEAKVEPSETAVELAKKITEFSKVKE